MPGVFSKLRVPAGALVLAAALPLVVVPAARADVLIAELPGLPGYPTHRAAGVNDLGQVIGTAEGNGPIRAVHWTPGGAAADLGAGSPGAINQQGQVLISQSSTSGGYYVNRPRVWQAGQAVDVGPSGAGWVSAAAINGRGEVPMSYSSSPSGYHQTNAAVWRDGTHVALPVSGPHLFISAINDAGVVVGSKLPMFEGDRYAFRCAGTTCTRLAEVPGTDGYEVRGINEAGVVVGNRDDRVLRWEGDQVTVLSPGRVAYGSQVLNERGDAVGSAADANGVRRATLWPAGGKPVDLGVPGPSEAVAVNDLGDVVGWSGSSSPRAFLWRAGKVTWLGSLGGTRSRPVALNNRGVVVGESTDSANVVKAVKWTVPAAGPVR
ncbi:hypothetical protein [Saccharothrix syringae]|uniref:HAF repeat-containing protein n=1 Tax=Saccharothrix syringae TaxID=103733 RepID=A0A5Q0GZI5_SACSY|nr:hypothetical protein [Saccharothrix syringae]QFZ19431.1 hypothetical protein EKG83_20085 [Saccharothrix syringae]